MPAAARPFIAALGAAVLLAGCQPADDDDGVDFQGEQRLVANTIEDLEDAGADRDTDEICSLLSQDLVERIRATAEGRQTCPEALEDPVDDADSFDLDVRSIELSGSRATAVVESEDGDDAVTDRLGLVKESGRWKIDALSGATAPAAGDQQAPAGDEQAPPATTPGG